MQGTGAAMLAGMLIVAAGAATGRAATAPLETVPRVDLGRYTGKWYEIARYPNSFEKKCDRDVTAEYSIRPDGNIRVVNTCRTAEGKQSRASGVAKVADKGTNAKLKVTFFWPFYGDYWILDLGKNYEYAVVGEPSRKYLWILSRSAQLPEATYRGILGRLSGKGYGAAKLVVTRQSESGDRAR